MSTTAAGLEVGTFRVDSSGQATYRIPIPLPPGIGGQKPALEIAYDHRRGNGAMGIGWSLSGLSSIVRMKANPSTDGYQGAITFTDGDRLALDGKRLVNVQGDYWAADAVYYLEDHDWRQVIAGAAATDGFTVYTKNGDVLSYGTTTDSCIMAGSQAGTVVRAWALASIEDLNGNIIQFSYTNTPYTGSVDTGEYYLSTISYSVRTVAPVIQAQRILTLAYQSRPDLITVCMAGQTITTSALLATVAVMIIPSAEASPVPVTSYAFVYEQSAVTNQSRLSSITRTGADGSTLRPTGIYWGEVDQLSFDCSQPTTAVTLGRLRKMFLADIDGDGKTELIAVMESRGHTLLAGVVAQSDDWQGQISFAPGASSALLEGYDRGFSEFLPADVNGDGMADLVVAFRDRQTGNLSFDIYLSTGCGYQFANRAVTRQPYDPLRQIFRVLDVNGDGRSDIVQAVDASGSLVFNIFISDLAGAAGNSVGTLSSPFAPIATSLACSFDSQWLFAMDLNGDGLVDLLYGSTASGSLVLTPFISLDTPTGLQPLVAGATTNLGTVDGASFLSPLDVNGDGLVDLVWIQSTSLTLSTLLSNGAGQFTINQSGTLPTGFVLNIDQVYCINSPSEANLVALSTPSGATQTTLSIISTSNLGATVTVTTQQVSQTVSPGQVLIGDLSGTGVGDMLWYSAASDFTWNITPFPARGNRPNLVKTLRDPMGAEVSIDYAPLSDARVYAATVRPLYPKTSGLRFPDRLSPALFPVQEILGLALYVVAGYVRRWTPPQTPVAIDLEEERFGFQYEDAKLNLSGRGWEGFRKRTTVNFGTGLHKIETYGQDFPFTGRPTSVRLEAAGALLQEVVSSYCSRAPSTAPCGRAVETLQTGQILRHFEDGRLDYVVGSTFSYDAYGNCSMEVWNGYIQDPPDAAMATPGAPTLTPLDPDEVVYHHRRYQNTTSSPGWSLGYLLWDKVTVNAVDGDITSFKTGDLTLAGRTYFSGTCNVQTDSAWDDGNQVWLTTAYTYGATGNLATQTAPGGGVTTWVFESNYHSFAWSCTSPANNSGTSLVTLFGYDPRFGIEVARQDPNQTIFAQALDGFGRVATKQGSAPPTTSPATNQVTSWVTGDTPTTFTQASLVTLEQVTFGGGGLAELHWFGSDQYGNSLGNVTRELDALGRERRLSRLVDDRTVDTFTNYAPCGKPALRSLPLFRSDSAAPRPPAVLSTYDPLGRLLSRSAPIGTDGADTTLATWRYGRRQTVTEVLAEGSDSAFSRVLQRHLFFGKPKIVQISTVSGTGEQASLAVTTFGYNRLGWLTQAVDPNGIANSFVFDSLGRLASANDPDRNTTGTGAAIQNAYHAATGLLKSATDASGGQRSFTYDALGRTLSKTLSDGRVVTYVYDTSSPGYLAQVSIADSSGTVVSSRTFTNDLYGQVSSESLSFGDWALTTSSVMNWRGQLLSRNYPDGTTLTNTYSSNGLLNKFLLADTNNNSLISGTYYQFTAMGLWQNLQLTGTPIGELNLTYGYSPCGLLMTETVNETEMNLTYCYDSLMRLRSMTDSAAPAADQTESFSYQDQRLVGATLPRFTPSNFSFAYDPAGNLTSKDGNSVTYNAHFPASITGPSGTVLYTATQDDCGRTISRTVGGTTSTFAYDGFGALCSVSNAQGVVKTMTTEDDGRLLQESEGQKTTLFLAPDYQLIQEDAGNGTTSTIRKYVFDGLGPVGMVETIMPTGPSTATLFRRDHKGSITRLYQGGAVTAINDFAPYGRLQIRKGAESANPTFEGKSWSSASGLYRFGARYYDPNTGRFLTPDSQLGGQSLARQDVWNRFAFELNEPINHIDPSGHSVWDDFAGFFLGVVEIWSGIALGVELGGLAGSVAAGALISAGTGAIVSTATNPTKNDQFWAHFWEEQAINLVVGGVLGAAIPAAEGAIATAAFGAVAKNGLTIAVDTVISAAGNAGGQFVTNAVEGNTLGEGLTGALVFGGAFGALGAIGPRVLFATPLGDLRYFRLAAERDVSEQLGRPISSLHQISASDFNQLQIPKGLNYRPNVVGHPWNAVQLAIAMRIAATRQVFIDRFAVGFAAAADIGYGPLQAESIASKAQWVNSEL
ncbi:RHS repeat-associated core domain-containing protein [Bradyrhizobium sp. HKCCYLS20291]|uniref:RHS repeat-associated core domain-containing protein n=1 Tax=Bradyrhizobium sp. HKCCYLS20291 TaxID=3420766 RepID=UPI003EB823B5